MSGFGFSLGFKLQSDIPNPSGIFGAALTDGGALFDADYGVVLDGSNAIAWTSQVGASTAHRPAYYGYSGNAPTIDTTEFSGRNAIKFTSAGTQSLILDGLTDVFDGAIDTKVWTVILHMVPLADALNVFVCAGGKDPITNYAIVRGTTSRLKQYDTDANTDNSTGLAPAQDTETISVLQHDGRDVSTWENATPYGSNPFLTDSLGSLNVTRVNFNGRWYGVDSWASYHDYALRRALFLTGIVTQGQLNTLQNIWYGK